MRAELTGQDFNRLIAATKGFLSTDQNRYEQCVIKMVFDKMERTVTANALDGFKMSRERAILDDIDEDFTAYIKPPRFKAKKDVAVLISLEGKEAQVRYWCGTIFTTRQPETVKPFEHEEVFERERDKPTVFQVGFNAGYLLDALKASVASQPSTMLRLPVVLEFKGDKEPAFMTVGKSGTRMILPVRMSGNNGEVTP